MSSSKKTRWGSGMLPPSFTDRDFGVSKTVITQQDEGEGTGGKKQESKHSHSYCDLFLGGGGTRKRIITPSLIGRAAHNKKEGGQRKSKSSPTKSSALLGKRYGLRKGKGRREKEKCAQRGRTSR